MSDSAAAASFLSHFQVSSFPPVSAPRQVSPPCLGGRILQSWDILLWILKWQSYFDINHTLKFLSAQESDNVLSARSCFLIGNGKCKQLSDWSELELTTVSNSCALRNLSVTMKERSQTSHWLVTRTLKQHPDQEIICVGLKEYWQLVNDKPESKFRSP